MLAGQALSWGLFGHWGLRPQVIRRDLPDTKLSLFGMRVIEM